MWIFIEKADFEIFVMSIPTIPVDFGTTEWPLAIPSTIKCCTGHEFVEQMCIYLFGLSCLHTCEWKFMWMEIRDLWDVTVTETNSCCRCGAIRGFDLSQCM